jgi:hypothetical protein
MFIRLQYLHVHCTSYVKFYIQCIVKITNVISLTYCLDGSTMTPQSRQSAKVFSSHRNWDSPTPSPRTKGGGQLLLARKGAGGANSDDWRENLVLCGNIDTEGLLNYFSISPIGVLIAARTLPVMYN